MKARYQYRFYPSDQQRQNLAQLFGCCRVVWNDALAMCKQSEKLPKNGELQKLVITQAKKTVEREWLSGVSVTPLQQSVADLGIAYKNFFDSLKGKRKGSKVGAPKFKKKTGKQSARFTLNSFSIKGDEVYLAKIGNVKPIWSRSLPSMPSSVTVIKDAANRYFLSFIALEELKVSGMVKNRRLARAISFQGWREFRVLCEVKSQKLDREFVVISRWEPTSQVCSKCGYRWGKIDLSIRSVLCLSCGTEHDRDENAARNIERVGMGHRHDLKRTRSDCQTTFVAGCCESSRIPVL